MRVAMTVLDLVVEGSFGLEPETLENTNRLRTVRNHLGEKLFQARVLCQVHDRICQGMPQAAAAESGIGDNSDFTYMPGPSLTLALKDGSTNDPPASECDNHSFAVDVNFVKPDFDLIPVYQVFFKES